MPTSIYYTYGSRTKLQKIKTHFIRLRVLRDVPHSYPRTSNLQLYLSEWAQEMADTLNVYVCLWMTSFAYYANDAKNKMLSACSTRSCALGPDLR